MSGRFLTTVVLLAASCAAPAVAQAPPVSRDRRFQRLFWFEPGIASGNPVTNRRFRVNDPLVALHPEFGKRPEVRGNGMLQIELTEPLAGILAAELALELWGGHPGTTKKRVTVNGRSTYPIREIGTAAGHCTHQYPVIRLERSDLVQAHNVFQLACDRGGSFWGHFIVDNACLRVDLAANHPTLKVAKLAGFAATVTAKPAHGETIALALDVPKEFRDRIAGVDFQGYYDGFDENGDGLTRDWHGMTKRRKPYEQLGSSDTEPFRVTWDVTMLPVQKDMAVRAVVRFKDRPDLIFITPALTEIATPTKTALVRRCRPSELPRPFWSRDNKKKACDIPVDVDPGAVEVAELRVVLWDGGVEKAMSPLRLNGKPLAFASNGKHDVKSLRIRVDPTLLMKGKNTFEVLSDTTHHGIEVLLPGPELWLRLRTTSKSALTDPDAQRRAAMNSRGNAARGKALFASNVTKCATCHKVHGQGGDAGPDLSQVAGKLDRTHLIESILDPSAQVLEGYRTTTVQLQDGRVLRGIVQGETPAGFTLIDAENRKTTVKPRDVESRKTDAGSLMPADLTAMLSPAEFTDLIAYLETLRTGRKPNPGEGITGAVTLPGGFNVQAIANGLTGGTAMEIAPDGRIFVCEQTGALRVIKGGKLLPEPFVRLPVASTWERGLIGVTVAPDFPKTPHVFVCYVAKQPHPHHVVSRLTARGDVGEPGSEVVLFEGDDQTKLGGSKPDGHQGGAIHFGSDGKLYVTIGDGTADRPAQVLSSFQGKMLRLNPDGTIPSDNPFVSKAASRYRAVWALGLRNPFAFAVQPKTGRIFINDVSGKAEEVNEGVAGANYGWPTADHGPTANPSFRGPVHHYPTACITGGAFAATDSPWPAEYRGRYFYADFNHGFIKTLDPDRPALALPFATGIRRPVDLRFDAGGDLYVLVRDAWVIDQHFKPGTGSLLRVRCIR